MFLNVLLSTRETVITVILIIIGVALLAYLILLSVSFYFMHYFKRDINIKKDSINLILFQKIDLLIKLSLIMEPFLEENNPLRLMSDNKEFKLYQKIEPSEFEEFYVYTEKMLQLAQKVYIDSDLNEYKKTVEEIFLTIEELNQKYFQATQLYNTSVIAYNYWYNLFSTKWVKKLFFMKTIDSIK